MGLLLKSLFALMGLVLAIYFYSAKQEFKVSTQCRELGAASIHYVSGSMENMAFAQEVVKKAEKLWGGLDMLILNHVGSTHFGYFKGDIEHPRKLLEINVLSYVAMTVSALPMLKESRGSVVAVSSLAGKVGNPFTVPYSTTKFALDGFFSSLRQMLIVENANVSITLCVLGYINTESAMKAVSHVICNKPAPKEECALEIIKSGALRQRELHYPYISVTIPLILRDWVPDFLDALTRNIMDIEKVERT
ncbi:PREDICTED: corticosteroid 11-beta-dehydrogenase isozyme 1-like isoform X3 [Crocodylus porosus]|uniref:corticosteroid 11-beta-dehydrogenase isozyme 1-like isoform X3 n=1 Tax=Crocodylus porosus TaxID=8502 RepID=UPI00093B6E23|nr:PREDICTED: corticosteroid 11-beta-dehydrogenase isozyme 1-like isoform X3 [Crocodylus porosus]